ncbi:ATP-dependent RNA helicase DDX54 [Erpetoichthys calabaricus]|uniref:RNA helicase n=1 Tax=Erpetoichthys calabaricus TaxID=27687 RepID=A0A8C4TDC7_ERPCA|nr:ATP-dependent RNA helicase DDX54 [Erpetoichthys calabaricus]
MAQKKKRFTKKRKSTQRGKAAESDSDCGEFEVATGVSEMAALESKQVLPSFPTTECMSDVEPDTRELVRAQNKKKKKSGGFQSMGLSYPVYKGVIKKGYKVPTPIQRKTIPLILDGKDVVAMARTGSGKTAAFLIPMFQRLQAPSAQTGARAVILSPTRELALQTLKFTKELGKFTGLKTAIILGGDRMEDQFAALHENPDIIIATPGRLMHVAAEMNLKLNNVEYVVFDEADRLFEMGFASQLQEIIRRLPENRQTVLFSATLPKQLVEFASAGLIDPVLVRLDVDTKLSEQLKLAFFYLRTDDKPAFLLHMLRNVVKPQEQTVVFVATRHHVEYLKELLAYNGIDCAYIYSALDQTARKINIGKFTHRKAMVMIVTDVAARGIDIPMLDNVINYNFPCKAKLFLHRVGRVARAGRCGTAYSLISADELAFVFDLNLFLGRPMRFAGVHGTDKDEDGVLGRVPQCILDDEEATLERAHENSLDLHNLRRVSENAYKQYLKSRPNPSPESIKRAKETDYSALDIHPLLGSQLENIELVRLKMVDSVKCYKSKATIFEINSTSKTNANEVMRAKRLRDKKLVDSFQRRREEKVEEKLQVQTLPTSMTWEEDQEEIENVFSEVVGGKRKKPQNETNAPKKKTKISNSDKEFYIPYRPKDFDSERGLSMKGDGSSFERQATSAVLDLMGDEENNMNQHKSMMKWDRKRKRFVRETGKEDKKKMKTESGQLIKRSYKKNIYEDWKKKYKFDDAGSGNDSDGDSRGNRASAGGGRRRRGGPAPQRPGSAPKARSELKTKDQILKQRKKKAKQQFLQSGALKKLRRRNRHRLQEVKSSGFGRGGGKKGKLRKRL